MDRSTAGMTIGEVAARTGLPPKTIRYYEEIGLIGSPRRRGNGYRTYAEADAQTLRFVQRARALGFPIKDIAALLALYSDRERASRDVKRLALAHVAELDRRIAALSAIRDTISDLAERCHGDDRPECPIIDDLEATAPSDIQLV